MVTLQPASIMGMKDFVAMPYPGPIDGIQPGFEYLAHLDQMIFKEEIPAVEAYVGIQKRNKLKVLNSNHQQVYYAEESTPDVMHRTLAGPGRGYTMHVYDQSGQVIMTLNRQFKCCGAGIFQLADTSLYYPTMVFDKFGRQMGIVRQINSQCNPFFGAFDENEQMLFKIGPKCCQCQGCCCPSDMVFPLVLDKDGSEIGALTKAWVGCCKEMRTDIFSVTFPRTLEVKHKALLLALMLNFDLCMFP